MADVAETNKSGMPNRAQDAPRASACLFTDAGHGSSFPASTSVTAGNPRPSTLVALVGYGFEASPVSMSTAEASSHPSACPEHFRGELMRRSQRSSLSFLDNLSFGNEELRSSQAPQHQ